MAKLNGCVSDNLIFPETKHPNVRYGSRICLESTPNEAEIISSCILSILNSQLYKFVIINNFIIQKLIAKYAVNEIKTIIKIHAMIIKYVMI